MSFNNNEAKSVNGDISLRDHYFNNSSHSEQITGVNKEVSVVYSTLQPTANEFHPSTSSNGAVRKEPQRNFHKSHTPRSNNYGSGRTFSNSKGYRQNYEVEEFPRRTFANTQQYGELTKHSTENVNFNYKPIRGVEDVIEKKSSSSYSRNSFHRDENSGYQKYENSGYQKYKNHPQNFSRQKYDYKESGNNYERSNRSQFNKVDKFSFDNKFRKGSNNHSKGNLYSKSYTHRQIPNSISERYDKKDNNNDDHSFKENNSSIFKTNHFDNQYGKFDRRNMKEYGSQGSFGKGKNEKIFKNKKVDAASQKERLEEMIYNRKLECLVCCEKIKNNDKVWSCQLCYHILHLNCVITWAKWSKIENGWRCPACQNVCSNVPSEYKCYCGKNVEPTNSSSIIPHGCGDICLRKGRACDHKCTLLCHPGPCPDCSIMVSKPCGCGATNPIVKCSTAVELLCENVCNRLLECGIHRCKEKCHSHNCKCCLHMVKQECYCGKVGRKVPCRAENSGQSHYKCGEVCGKLLTCGHHTCEKLCHEGPCDTCCRDAEKIKTCPCGKTALTKQRESCLDPIACCDKVCGKTLRCGQPGFRHTCTEVCHEGDCPPCPLTTAVKCRCGHMDKELPCQNLTSNPDDTKCEKKCTKKRLCGKHKCNQRCCIELEHVCPLPCNHLLSCGQHRCERTCHSGRCRPCVETSFEELYCECGASVLYPPIPCGTKPPACNKPCSRPRPCEHDVNHNCHIGPCPPCTVLCKKWCHGRHQQRSAILCHQNNFSCGLVCGKEMPCKRHKCNKPCHEGPCPTVCSQPCTVPRRLCGHICGRPCHDPPCPESSCRQKVEVICSCGLQKTMKPCIEVSEEYKNLEMAQLRDKIGWSSKDQAVDISDIISTTTKPSTLKILDCNEECRIYERNRRLAIGLQIRNPDLSQKLTPKYSDFMRTWAKKDSHFCQRVHDKLSDLVQLAKQSKQKSRSHSFESMNKDKRHFIHEYCEHFGVESAAYDSEPNRNVVATAFRDKSWLPSMSLLEVIQRENGQRKVPGPISVSSRSIIGKSETTSLKLPSRAQRPVSPPPGDVIDYFNAPL